MRKFIFVALIIICSLFIFIPTFQGNYSLTQVFRVTDEPAAITRGTYGTALTINISFGDEEIEEWLMQLNKPFPLLFIDMDWADRFPKTIRLIQEKEIQVGLLGHNGLSYETDATLFLSQIKKFEEHFNVKPLWFRTADEVFPYSLHTLLWKAEINAIGSSFRWNGGAIPPPSQGEIISIPHHKEIRTNLLELEKFYDNRDIRSLEDVLFGVTSKTKKIPE